MGHLPQPFPDYQVTLLKTAHMNLDELCIAIGSTKAKNICCNFVPFQEVEAHKDDKTCLKQGATRIKTLQIVWRLFKEPN